MRNLIRMAGQKVRAFDDAYASKLANYIGSFNTKKPSMGQNVQAAAGLAAGVPATRKFPVEADNQILAELMGYGVPALNAGVRYGVPLAAGYTAANALGGFANEIESTPVIATTY